jgi:hypothetical protein
MPPRSRFTFLPAGTGPQEPDFSYLQILPPASSGGPT